MTVPAAVRPDAAPDVTDAPVPADRSMRVLELAVALGAALAAFLLGLRPG